MSQEATITFSEMHLEFKEAVMAVSIFLALLLILALCVIAVFALLIYKAVCNHRIKKQLSGEVTYKRKFIEPHHIIIIILSVMLAIMFVVLTAFCGYKVPNMDNYQSVFYTPEELEDSPLAIYKEAYTQKSLTGYTREEVQEDNFKYILYKSEDDYNSMLYPTFIMFVEYTGNKMFEGSVAMDSIDTNNSGYSTAIQHDEVPDYYFVCSNIDSNADFTFKLGLYSKLTDAKTDFSNETCVGADETFELKL